MLGVGAAVGRHQQLPQVPELCAAPSQWLSTRDTSQSQRHRQWRNFYPMSSVESYSSRALPFLSFVFRVSTDGLMQILFALLPTCKACPAKHSNFKLWSLCAACRYLFNAGEGFQRYCVEHRHRLVRMKQVLATRASHTALGGLPGANLLHFQRV